MRFDQGGGACEKNGMSMNGEVKLPTYQLVTHVSVG
jgi:hypothetical protein